MRQNAFPMILTVAVLALTGCNKETREGQLTLSGTAPVRFVSEGGKLVEFYAGPTKVEFSANSRDKIAVVVSQQDKKAVFSGKAPAGEDWNFVLRGKDIGQPVDMTSRRQLTYKGKPQTAIVDGGFCGSNGRWVVEEKHQACDEEWTVAFADANTSLALGNFRSFRGDRTCVLSSRNLYCRDEMRPVPVPIPPRFE
jgi:hypothetical protein